MAKISVVVVLADTETHGDLGRVTSWHEVFENVRDHIAGACEFCANAFEVKEEVRNAPRK